MVGFLGSWGGKLFYRPLFFWRSRGSGLDFVVLVSLVGGIYRQKRRRFWGCWVAKFTVFLFFGFDYIMRYISSFIGIYSLSTSTTI